MLLGATSSSLHRSTLAMRVRQVLKDTPEAIRVVLDAPKLRYQSGQYLVLAIPIRGKIYKRAYSLCTAPHDPYPAILIKRIPNGLVSNYLNDTLLQAAKPPVLQVMPPKGRFTLTYDASNHNKYVLIAGGSGITPLFSLAKSILYQEPKSHIHLFYGNRSAADILLHNELQVLQTLAGEQLQVHYVVEKADATTNSKNTCIGQLDKKMLEQLLTQAKAFSQQARYLICGPSPVRQAAVALLGEKNIPLAQIQYESFVATQTLDSKALSEEAQVRYPVTIEHNGKRHEVSVADGDTILAAGLAAGLDLPYSCQSGICTTCRGLLLAGTVDRGEAEGLSSEEEQQGYVLCCSASPTNEAVVIRIE